VPRAGPAYMWARPPSGYSAATEGRPASAMASSDSS
jgi:hypothetical protein